MRKCKKCGIEKEINLFRKNGKWFKHTCKECLNSPNRTGRENTGRFKKGEHPSPQTEIKKGEKLAFKNSSERGAKRSKEWCDLVKKRDNYKCVKCEATEKLHAHHIIPRRQDKTKMFELSNGETLCSSCHSRTERLMEISKGACLEKRFKKGRIPWNKGLKKNI